MSIADLQQEQVRTPAELSVYRFGRFRYDARERILVSDDGEIALPPRVVGVLHVLLENSGRIVGKSEIIDAVWGGTFVSETSLSEAVSVLRQALGDDAQTPQFVQTVHRRGYRFVAAVATETPQTAASASSPPVVISGPRRHTLPILLGVALFLVAVAGFFAGRQLRDPVVAAPPVHFSVPPPPGTMMTRWAASTAISPNGRDIVFVAGSDEELALYHRSLDTFVTRRLPGTEGATTPFFSPDGKWLGFFSKDALKKMQLRGGVAIDVIKIAGALGATWTEDHQIIFGSEFSGLKRVSADGGTVEVLTTPDAARGEVVHAWPHLLPGGKALVFTIHANTLATSKVAALSLSSRKIEQIVTGGAGAQYAPSGYLVYARSDAVAALRFDAAALRVEGAPFAISGDVATHPFAGLLQLAIARNGTMVYLPSSSNFPLRELYRLRADGAAERLAPPQRLYRNLDVAPDGRRAAVTILEHGRSDVWIANLDTGTLQRLTFEGFNIEPVWSRDGEWVYYASNRSGPYQIYRRRATGEGAEERVMASRRHQYPFSWSPDGTRLVYGEAHPERRMDIWVREKTATGWSQRPLVQTAGSDFHAEISPDGKWLTYDSDESGRYDVFLQEFPRGEGKRQVSSSGGDESFWSPDGSKLYFHSAGALYALDFPSPNAAPVKVLERTDVVFARQGRGSDPATFIRQVNKFGQPDELRVVVGWSDTLARQAR